MADTDRPRWANVWGFFAATYALTWLIWLGAIFTQGEEPKLLFIIIGAFVPSTMGTVFTYLAKDRQGQREFWQRVIDVRRIGWRWLLIIALIFPAAHAIAMLIYALLGGTPPTLANVRSSLLAPGIMLQLVFANLIVSGLSEELGWRGFALDPLQRRWGALRASLLLGLVHGIWHLPLFFVPGITQGEMGLLSFGALVFLAGGLVFTPILTWVYNNTGRSILSAILLHFAANLCLDLLLGLQAGLPVEYMAVYASVLFAIDALIVAIWGAKTMTGRQRSTSYQEASAA